MEYKLSKGATVTYGGTDKMAAIFHTAILNAFYRMKMKIVPKGPINNIVALIQIMDWHRPGDKPLSEPIVLSLLTHICVTRPQWVKVKQAVFVDIALWDFLLIDDPIKFHNKQKFV